MTTATLAPAPSRARATRATGYARLGCGALAAGPHGEQGSTRAARVVLPLEMIVAVDAKVRTGGQARHVTTNGPDHLAHVAAAAADLVLDRAGIAAADVQLSIRTQYAGAATDASEATVLAVDHALRIALELTSTTAERTALVHDATGKPSAGLVDGRPAVVTTDGHTLTRLDTDQRLNVVYVAPPAPLAAADVPPDARFGQLPAPCDDLAAWLLASVGTGRAALTEQIAALASTHESVIGVVGGHEPTHPVLVLLADEPAALRTAQRLSYQLRELVDAGWSVAVTRTAARPTW